MILKLAATVLAFAIGTVTVLADPVGRYTSNGTNPGGGAPWSGTVEVQRTGDTYRVTWNIGGTIFTGTGIGSRDFLAVSYRSGSQTGIALYGRQSDGTWQGVWTYAGSRQIAEDRWNPR